MTQEKTAEQILLDISALHGELAALKAAKEKENVAQITSEVFNLVNAIGDQFVEGDDWAKARVYSQIPGVKNIRMSDEDNKILVKVSSPSGFLLPESINVEGTKYTFEFMYSSKYEERVDY